MQNVISPTAPSIVGLQEEVVKRLSKPVVCSVVLETLRQEGLDDVDGIQAVRELEGEEDEETALSAKDIAHQILYIADKINIQLEEQKIIQKIQNNLTEDGFNQTCEEYIALGGANNWGRIATFIYINCKVAVKALVDRLQGIPVFEQVIKWTIKFITDKLVPWIARAGGWVAILDSTPGSPYWKLSFAFVVGMLAGSYIMYRYIKTPKTL